jgi:HEXXH motif-containing protein
MIRGADSTEVTGHGLVLCEGPTRDTRGLQAAYARYLAGCCHRFQTIGPELPSNLRRAHPRIAEVVRQALGKDPRQVLNCFASPTVGTPLRCLRLRSDLPSFRAGIEDTAALMMPHLLLEMGLRRLITEGETVIWEQGAPRLASLAIGGEIIPPEGATALEFSATHVAALGGGIELARLPLDRDAMQGAFAEKSGGFRFQRRYRRLGKVTHFATLDHNPVAEFDTHPDKAGNPVDLGGRSEEEWVSILDEALALVEYFMPGEFAEMRMMLHEVVPVGYDAVRHLSASYREAIGTIYLTLHPSVMVMTEAVVHEFQHNKFNVASDSVDYLRNAFHPLYKSPVRPDPRPLGGILLAVHAFLPVADLYRRIRDGGHPLAAHPDFDRRISDLDLKNHEGMEMLRAHGEFTRAGRAVFGELEAMESRHLAERNARGLANTPTEVHVA